MNFADITDIAIPAGDVLALLAAQVAAVLPAGEFCYRQVASRVAIKGDSPPQAYFGLLRLQWPHPVHPRAPEGRSYLDIFLWTNLHPARSATTRNAVSFRPNRQAARRSRRRTVSESSSSR